MIPDNEIRFDKSDIEDIVKTYIKENLTIDITRGYSFEEKCITVTLYLCSDRISQSYISV